MNDFAADVVAVAEDLQLLARTVVEKTRYSIARGAVTVRVDGGSSSR